jgi:chaperonin GroES
MAKVNPVPGYLTVEPQKIEKTTESGIVLPDSHEEKPLQGKVLSVGASYQDDGNLIKPPCKAGDIVVYKEWGGKEYKNGDKNILILKFEDVIATIS